MIKSDKELKSKKAAHSRAVFFDKLAKYSIYAGGIAVIIAITGILVFILLEALPLLSGADAEEKAVIKTERNGLPVLTGIDEYQEIAYIISDSGSVEFVDLSSQKIIRKFTFTKISNRTVISAATDFNKHNVALGLDSGKVAILSIEVSIQFDENDNRIITPDAKMNSVVQLDS